MRLMKSTLNPFIQALGWTAIWATAITSITSCISINTQTKATAPPMALVLETKVYVRGGENNPGGRPRFNYVNFDVPKAGYAVLRVVNAAKIGAMPDEHLAAAMITLNGQPVVTPKTFNIRVNMLNVRVRLRQGNNRLGVRLQGKPGKRLSVRIDAPAGKIEISPVFNPVVLGRQPLRVRATVTELGIPVVGAQVHFKVHGLGPMIERRAKTGNSGMATTLITGFPSAGVGLLQARVAGTSLLDKTLIQTVKKPSITLKPQSSQLVVGEGSAVSFGFTINVLKSYNTPNLLTLAQTITPNLSGFTSKNTFPPNGVVIKAPRNIPVTGTVTGLTPGQYTLSLTTTLKNSHESASAKINIRVQELLSLNAPAAIPGAIPPSPKPVMVTFRTLITGTRKPPKLVLLDEVTADGKLVAKSIAKLRDNGKGKDTIKGDGFYAATINITSPVETNKPVEGEKYYRLRAKLSGNTITSNITTFPITKLPLKARPSDPKTLIDNPPSLNKLYANEVIVSALPGVSPQRVKTIVDEVGKTLNQESTIVGFTPTLNQYLVEIEGDGTFEGIHRTVKVLLGYREEIKDAAPNFVGLPAGAPTDERFPPIVPNNIPQCISPNNVSSKCQYYMQTIRAEEAWDWLTNFIPPKPHGSLAVKVAVIDTGIDSAHIDLDNQIVGGSNTSPDEHGTAVAGLIAATHGTGYIAGVAPGTQLEPYSYTESSTWTTIEGLAQSVPQEVKIINISRQWTTEQTAIGSAICDAINKDRLVVVAAGNLAMCPITTGEQQSVPLYPAKYDAPGQCPSTCTSGCKALVTVGALDIDGGNNDGTVDNDNLIATQMVVHLSTPVDSDGNSSGCSNVQPWIDMYAPGDDIVSTSSPLGIITDRLGTFDGTSFAAPLVSGAAAVLWAAYPDWSAQDVAACLRTRGRPLDLTSQVHPLLDGNDDPLSADVVGVDSEGVIYGRVLDIYTAVNHAPTDIGLSNSSVDEGAPGAVVGSLSAVDHCVSTATSSDSTKPDGVTFSVNDTRFEVVGRQLKLKNGNALNHPTDCTITGADCTVTLTITATDAEDLKSSENFEITVTPVSPQLIVDQENAATTGTSYGCGVPPMLNGTLTQSFIPTDSRLAAVELDLRKGGSFPSAGYNTNVRILSDGPNGPELGSSTTTIPGPSTTGGRILGHFTFSPALNLTVGNTYAIQWESPQEGGVILTWMGAEQNPNGPYANGAEFTCSGIESPDVDLLFTTYRPGP